MAHRALCHNLEAKLKRRTMGHVHHLTLKCRTAIPRPPHHEGLHHQRSLLAAGVWQPGSSRTSTSPSQVVSAASQGWLLWGNMDGLAWLDWSLLQQHSVWLIRSSVRLLSCMHFEVLKVQLYCLLLAGGALLLVVAVGQGSSPLPAACTTAAA